VAEIEELCYAALWFGEALGREASTKASILLSATRRLAPTTDREEGLRLARSHLSRYLQLPNYRNSWLRQGFQEENLFGDGSERLAEGLAAWGFEGNIRERVHEHLSAGAHQVCVRVVKMVAGTVSGSGGARLLPRFWDRVLGRRGVEGLAVWHLHRRFFRVP
jgi:hypothetical protein